MPTPAPRPIVVVDDDPNDLFLFAHYLRKGKVVNPVERFSEPEHALQYLEQTAANDVARRPMVVFTDLKMPRFDGVELIKKIKQHATLGPLRVIAMSSSGLDEDLARAKAAGADDYLVKFPPLEVLEQIVRDAEASA